MFPFANTAQLSADYWLEKLSTPHVPYLSTAQIRQHNAQMLANEPSLLDLNQVPFALPKATVLAQLSALSQRTKSMFYTADGVQLDESIWRALIDNCTIEGLAETIEPRYGLAVNRANLRRFPSSMPVYLSREGRDIDRFQESVLFPGDAVIVLHQSRDQAWWYVVSQYYRAWVAKEAIVLGDREQVLGYTQRQQARTITGSVVHTVYTPQLPTVSRLPLDMGVRIPLCTHWPLYLPVNGQLAAASWILELPLRHSDGSLTFTPALLPHSADSASDYLPFTPANIIRQAFKFLGERYGWGHDFYARDCSGLVCEIYRSFNLLLPRNSGDQVRNSLLSTLNLPPAYERPARCAVLQNLQVGDLVYIPGHVMLVIGHDQGLTWVIHDIAKTGYIHSSGHFIQIQVNGVVVTPLEQLYLDINIPYVERIIGIKRIRR